MPFIWDAAHTAHLGKHGVSLELAERVFWAGCGAIFPARIKHRLIVDRSREGVIYPITCFPL